MFTQKNWDENAKMDDGNKDNWEDLDRNDFP